MNTFFPGFERKQIEVNGASISPMDCGQYLPEEQPDEIAREPESFFG
jgi:hypothetical protein